jgi:hypothetical protein
MLNIFGSATLLRKATLLPLGYDGSIAYPWCPRFDRKRDERALKISDRNRDAARSIPVR